jgi:broad-specificity NMP kinase
VTSGQQEVEPLTKHAPGALITWVLPDAAADQLRNRLHDLGWDRQKVDETLQYANELAVSTVADVRVDNTGLSVGEVAAL